MTIIKKIKNLRCNVLFKLCKSKIIHGKNVTFGRGTTFYAPKSISIGNNVYIGKYCSIETDIYIGDNVLIGNHVGLIGKYDHDYSQIGINIKESPWIGDSSYDFKGKGLSIIVEDDVWIGFGVIVLSGVKIGRGSIIGAGALVNRDIPPYSICTGNPVRIIKSRFNDCEIQSHEKILYGEMKV